MIQWEAGVQTVQGLGQGKDGCFCQNQTREHPLKPRDFPAAPCRGENRPHLHRGPRTFGHTPAPVSV